MDRDDSFFDSVPDNPVTIPKGSYLEHLETLRWKIISTAVVFLVLFIAAFFFVDRIVAFLQLPISSMHLTLNYFKPYEKFLIYTKIALFAAAFAVVPFVLVQVGHFLYPALKKGEKAPVVFALVLVPFIFTAGIAFSYYILIPAALNFFIGFAQSDGVVPVLSIGDYFDFVLSLLAVCGLIFETPLVLLVFIRVGILDPKTLSKYRRFIILGIAIVAAILSPPDVISQLLIGVPMYLMFELTIILGKILRKKKKEV